MDDLNPRTQSAAIIWKAVAGSQRPISEAEIRKATGLGVATVNRMTRSMVQWKLLQRHAGAVKHPTCGATCASAHYSALGTLEEVQRRLCARPAADRRPEFVPNGYGIGRVPSVFHLGAMVTA